MRSCRDDSIGTETYARTTSRTRCRSHTTDVKTIFTFGFLDEACFIFIVFLSLFRCQRTVAITETLRRSILCNPSDDTGAASSWASLYTENIRCGVPQPQCFVDNWITQKSPSHTISGQRGRSFRISKLPGNNTAPRINSQSLR